FSDYKVTAPECPFSTDARANVAKHVFDAFRAEGLGIAAYFSKPDWHTSHGGQLANSTIICKRRS
ncbi:MAG: hypothetical protein II703_03255, partial [Ruminococcus sp.]|nr:hypothetical protein [Ruminococcus sp.]